MSAATGPDASIIVVTAFPSMDSAVQCLRARTYDYLTKPFQITQLQRVVLRCLESKGLLRMSEAALREALRVPRKRVPTKPTAAARRRRLEQKKRRSQTKRLRRPPD